VIGTETVAFTPDLPTDELVFRLVPNGPDPTTVGNQLTVTGVRGDDVATSGYESAGATEPGGLYVVGLSDPLATGESTRVTLQFSLRLGDGGFERLVVGQRGPAAGLADRGRLGAPPVRHASRRDGDQPGRRHHDLGRGARGADRADDR
jgi:hypothetical protein